MLTFEWSTVDCHIFLQEQSDLCFHRAIIFSRGSIPRLCALGITPSTANYSAPATVITNFARATFIPRPCQYPILTSPYSQSVTLPVPLPLAATWQPTQQYIEHYIALVIHEENSNNAEREIKVWNCLGWWIPGQELHVHSAKSKIRLE